MRECNDPIDYWVNKAHNIFNKTSIFEVADLDNELAKEFLNEVYGNPKTELIDQYLEIVNRIIMDLSELRQRAKEWRQEMGYVEKCGVVIFFGDELQGWVNSLRDPQHWQPGCIAIDEFGLCYDAVGGNAQDGASRWEPI